MSNGEEQGDRYSLEELMRNAGITGSQSQSNAPRYEQHLPPTIVFTLGDLNGIGIEVLVKALEQSAVRSICKPAIVGNARLIGEYLKALARSEAQVIGEALYLSNERVPIIDIPSDASLNLGEIDARAGKLAGDAIVRAAQMTLAGDADAIVTMPISKRALNAGGFDFPGHTEMLASIAGGEPLMILMAKGLRVAIVTIHAALRDVPAMITWDRIELRARQLERTLRADFNIDEPRIAVLGLNPHAGEDGLIGREETEVIRPTLHHLRNEGLRLEGPFPADGFFARFSPGEYDAVLAMYHDQGLIPLKLYARGAGVNYTAGLSIVRTSPDHGTAFPLAGRNAADERSVVEAVEVAVEVVRNRRKRIQNSE
jgi:4-hydroxythreonine-4-phosphate dehydrogenase